MKTIKEIKNVQLKTRSGKNIRLATCVVFSDDTFIQFTEKMTKKEAIRNANYQLNKAGF